MSVPAKRVRIVLRDPFDTTVTYADLDVQMTGDEENPGDPTTADDPIFAEAARFLAAMASEGRECSVVVQDMTEEPE